MNIKIGTIELIAMSDFILDILYIVYNEKICVRSKEINK